eukprot:jgi/Astpho2/6654/fgenesh1_pg.00101_%23_43_t
MVLPACLPAEGMKGQKHSGYASFRCTAHPAEINEPVKDAVKDAPDFVKDKDVKRLDRAFQKMEDKLSVTQNKCALESFMGEYKFDDKEKDIFRYLTKVMRRLAFGNFLVGVVSILLMTSQAARAKKAAQIPFVVIRGFSISSIAYVLDSFVAGAITWMAAVSFKAAASAETRQQLPHVFQGIMQVGVLFTQVTTVTLMLAAVQALEAAVRWPEITVLAAIGCAIIAATRTAALALVMAKYTPGSGKATMAIMGMREGQPDNIPLLDKAALGMVGGLLLPFSMPMDNPFLEKAKEDSVKPKDGVEGGDEMEEREQEDGPSYEFNNQEATVVEVVMDSMRICALALAVQFASTFLLGAAMVGKGEVTALRSFSMQLLDQGIRASLLFAAAGCFHRVVSSEGRDMKHLLEGLGRHTGLGLLFYRMQSIAFGVATFKSIEVVLPWITGNPTVQHIYHKVMNKILALLPNVLSNLLAKVI